MENMKTHKARAENGRLRLDVPTDLPDGAEVDVLVLGADESFDSMDPAERAELEAAIDESLEQAARGETISAEESLRRLQLK